MNSEKLVLDEFKDLEPNEMGACIMWWLQEQIKVSKEVVIKNGLDRGSLELLHHLVETYNWVCDCSEHEHQVYKYGEVI